MHGNCHVQEARVCILRASELISKDFNFRYILTIFRPGFFGLVIVRRGGGRIPPPPLNSENIKAMTSYDSTSKYVSIEVRNLG